MITAHLPAGYLLSRGLPGQASDRRAMVAVVLAASVLPDVDLIWFYLVDHRAIHHHRYWMHAPGFWLLLGAVALPLLRLLAPRALPYGVAALVAVLLHLVLDTLAGSIMWLWPLSDQLYVLAIVPPRYGHWVVSFLTHWTFLAELAIWAAALILLARRGAPA